MFIRLAQPRDRDKVAKLVEASFGRHDEVLLIEALRKEKSIVHEWVATLQEELVGHLIMSRLRKPKGCLALAPVSVTPEHQGEGIGSALIHAALEEAEEAGWVAAFVLGDPDYYGRFGFDVSAAGDFETPFVSEFTAAAVFDTGGFSGLSREIEYAKAFAVI